MSASAKITVQTIVNASIEKVWQFWTTPAHIMQWCNASSDWHAPYADNDLRIDGRFKTTMAAKDGSMSFDFEGTYTNIETYNSIEYKMDDERAVKIDFIDNGNSTHIVETFDPESINPLEMQEAGWQAILDNFKKYTENSF
jgi:uncharacterized protein YndB with AHSA1/START domain